MSHKLRAGDLAPRFSQTDITEKLVSLNYAKNKYRLIVFMRYAGCPWCNLAIHRLVLEQQLLKNSGCSVIVFVQSSKENIVGNIIERHERKPQFPIIADPYMKIYKSYGVRPSITHTSKMIKNIPHWVHAVKNGGYEQKNIDGNLFLAPAAFLISPNKGKIIRADYSIDMFEHESFSHIYDSIADHELNG